MRRKRPSQTVAGPLPRGQCSRPQHVEPVLGRLKSPPLELGRKPSHRALFRCPPTSGRRLLVPKQWGSILARFFPSVLRPHGDPASEGRSGKAASCYLESASASPKPAPNPSPRSSVRSAGRSPPAARSCSWQSERTLRRRATPPACPYPRRSELADRAGSRPGK